MLHGTFGYDSVEAHMEWRKQPEHAEAGKMFAELKSRGIELRPADLPGIDPATGCFHVKFHKFE